MTSTYLSIKQRENYKFIKVVLEALAFCECFLGYIVKVGLDITNLNFFAYISHTISLSKSLDFIFNRKMLE